MLRCASSPVWLELKLISSSLSRASSREGCCTVRGVSHWAIGDSCLLVLVNLGGEGTITEETGDGEDILDGLYADGCDTATGRGNESGGVSLLEGSEV